MREYFLDHEEYTHLVICPDDLLVKPEDLAQLISNIDTGKFPVISGLCNVDSTTPETVYNITRPEHLPHARRALRRYEWITDDFLKAGHKSEPFRVGYAGFPLFAIDRETQNKIPFRNDGGCCIDVMFCWDCHHAGIPIYVDPKIKLLHLKIKDGTYQDMPTGRREPFIYISEQS